MASPEFVLLTKLIEHAAGAVSNLLAGAPAEEVERQHALQVSRRLKEWQVANGAAEPPIPIALDSPSEPPRTEEA